MCGIVGILGRSPKLSRLDQMLSLIEHRGPDEYGTYADSCAGLGTARLSIIDLAGGQQPILDDDSHAVIAFNGEIFNYVELREQLVREGVKFKTRSDTEVILKLYGKHGERFPEYLNGQFAVSIWDARKRKLVLARDRFGICPLFYASYRDELLFASEIKCLLSQGLPKAWNLRAIDQIFTFWTTVSGHTIFEGVNELLPGHVLVAEEGKPFRTYRYWNWPFPSLQKQSSLGFAEAKERFLEELTKSVKIRLRADLEVGSYLSGGIDSSAIVAIASRVHEGSLSTYSIGFSDQSYDESKYQKLVIEACRTKNHNVTCTAEDIDRHFSRVIWHTENPLFRTAPSPMFALSSLVHGHGKKVVLTGEGADEILLGYDIFREVKLRRFWARQPGSTARPELFKKLYAYLPQFANPRFAALSIQSFKGTLESDSPFYSHLIRWNNNSANKVYFSKDLQAELRGYDAHAELAGTLPEEFAQVDDVDKAQYLELVTLLRGYLLSSQGDRMMMANSVEGRFPFLDHEFVAFCNSLPRRYKLNGLKDKFILRESMKGTLPGEVCYRPKFAYQAPEIRAFFRADKSKSPVAQELLGEGNLRDLGLFDLSAVSALLKKIDGSDLARLGTRDNMAFVQILSMLLMQKLFFAEDLPKMAAERASRLKVGTRLVGQ